MTRIIIAPLAEKDLESIGDYIARDDPARAISFVRELRGQCERIAINPQGYRQRPELGDGIRSCAHGNYIIFVEIESDTLSVVRILHGARDLSVQFGHDVGKDS